MIHAADRTHAIKEYYFSVKLKEIAHLNEAPEKVINLGIGNPDLKPSKATWQGLQSSCIDEKSHLYQSYQGLPELRKAFSMWYKRQYDVDIDSQTEILPLLGSKEGIMISSLAYLNHSDEVLIPNPSYPTYSSVSKLVGAKIRYYTLNEENNFAPDLKSLSKTDLSKVKIMWVNYPHMPTGAIASKALLQEIVDFGLKHNILIINDNPYSCILTQEPLSIHSCKGSSECALELNSLSKSHNMPGWRIGMISGSEKLLDPILKIKTNMDSGMFYPIQKAAIQALSNTDSWHKENNKLYKKRKDIVMNLLEILNCRPIRNQSGMFVWAAIPESYKNSYEFSDYILSRAKIFITPGSIFGDQGDRYIRISLCSKETTLKTAIERIIKTI